MLLVEDSDHIIEIYAKYLKFYGFDDVRFANNSKEALEKILEDKPDVVLIDLKMPVMDGYELCKKIRANPEISDVYIIASSGRDLPKGIKDYVDEISPKDNIRELMERLKEILGGKEK